MKLIIRIALGLALLVVIGVVILLFSLDGIIRSEVQSQATSSLNLQTTLGSASLSIFGGKVTLGDLAIASPKGFTAPEMFTLNSTTLAVNYSQLRSEPIHISSVVLTGPVLVVENSGATLNIQAAMNQMPSSAAPTPGPTSQPSAAPMKLIIDTLTVENAQVVVKPGNLPGLSSVLPADITVPVPSITLTNIGNGQGNGNGAAINDIIMKVITAMADSASKSGALPDALKSVLQLNVSGMTSQLGGKFASQLNAIGVPANLGQGIQSGLTNLIPGNNAATQPSSGNAIQQGLQGLFGPKKSQ
jgi:uncharacterized protein involved in outer membrane biogenesis